MKSPLFLIASALAFSLAVAGKAPAADLLAKAPIYAKAPVVTPAFSWQRCYIGVHAGYGWGRADWGNGALLINTSGLLVGGQAGCNWQPQGNLVIGIEGEVWWSDIHGSRTLSVALNDQIALVPYTARNQWDADVALRLGLAAGNTLFYVKGGGAYGNFRYTVDGTNLNQPFYTANESRFGWLIGAGIEHALNYNWTIKGEYNYIDYGASDPTFSPAGWAATRIAERKHIVKIGVNYLFGGPVVAKY